jgi:hypothetical protein
VIFDIANAILGLVALAVGLVALTRSYAIKRPIVDSLSQMSTTRPKESLKAGVISQATIEEQVAQRLAETKARQIVEREMLKVVGETVRAERERFNDPPADAFVAAIQADGGR